MAYEYKYFNEKSGDMLLKENSRESSVKMMERMDTMLAELRDEKGEYHAFTVAFLVEMRVLNATMKDHQSLASSRFIASYLTKAVKDKYGDNYKKAMAELIADSERISNEVVKVGTELI